MYLNIVVDVLCDAGSNLMGQDLATGLDSLHLAVIYNRLEIVDLLVHKYEADPFIKNMEGNNSFHICARTGNNGIVYIILFKMEKVDCTMCLTNIVLFIYMISKFISDIMKCLLAGAQRRKRTNDGMEYQDSNGRTAFHLACIYGHYDIAKLLVNDGKANPMVGAMNTSHFI